MLTEINDWKSYCKRFCESHNILFCTNSTNNIAPHSLVEKSMRTWVPLCHDFMVIPGSKNNGKSRHYGLYAFLDMLDYAISAQYDYIVYIDEDCFLIEDNIMGFVKELQDFVIKNEWIIQGVPDSECICHRNCGKYDINTFISFWNIKAIRECEYYKSMEPGYFKLDRCISSLIKMENFDNFASELPYAYFEHLKREKEIVKCAADYYRRNKAYKNSYSYLEIVRNPSLSEMVNKQPNEKDEIAPQVPYSTTSSKVVHEPYYRLIYLLCVKTKLPIKYFFARDIDDGGKVDGGLTSVITDYTMEKPFAVHGWYARLYNEDVWTNQRYQKLFEYYNI